jgi:toxin ParE1/3/4
MRIEWSVDALSDLQQISEYLEHASNLQAANRITRSIYDAVQSLRIMSNRGRKGRIENTRELMVQRLPYLVVYRVIGERVLILNIVHGARKWP